MAFLFNQMIETQFVHCRLEEVSVGGREPPTFHTDRCSVIVSNFAPKFVERRTRLGCPSFISTQTIFSKGYVLAAVAVPHTDLKASNIIRPDTKFPVCLR